jgi:hypothetical protein
MCVENCEPFGVAAAAFYIFLNVPKRRFVRPGSGLSRGDFEGSSRGVQALSKKKTVAKGAAARETGESAVSMAWPSAVGLKALARHLTDDVTKSTRRHQTGWRHDPAPNRLCSR